MTLKSCDRWLSVRLEIMGNFVVFFAAMAAAWASSQNNLKSGAAGWGLTQALAITGLLNWAVRCVSESETQMLSILRVGEIRKAVESSGGKESSRPGEAKKLIVGGHKNYVSSDAALMRSGWPWGGGLLPI